MTIGTDNKINYISMMKTEADKRLDYIDYTLSKIETGEQYKRYKFITDILENDRIFNNHLLYIEDHEKLGGPIFYKKYCDKLKKRGCQPDQIIYTSLKNLYKDAIDYAFIEMKQKIYFSALPEDENEREIIKCYRDKRGASIIGAGISCDLAPTNPRGIKYIPCSIINEYINGGIGLELFIKDFCDVLIKIYDFKIKHMMGRMD